MSIERNYNKIVQTKRLVDDSGNTESYQYNLYSVDCMIQPLDETFTEDLDGNFGKDYVMFCPVRDILEGDKIIDGTDEYKVSGLETFDHGSNRHMELRIRMSNQ